MYIGKVKYGDNTWPVGSTLYGTCDTAAGTAAKVVTMPDFDTLLDGVTIHVKFTHSNGAHVGNATLNVNNTGAKTIMRYGTTAAGAGASASWNAGAVVSFTYDGTYWLMNDWLDTDTNTTYTLSTGDSNGLIKVTPSSGSAYNVSVKGLGDRAFDNTSYLPLSGGILTNNSVHILNINNTGEESIDSGISFSKNGVRKAWVGYQTTQGAYLFNGARLKYLSYTDNGALLFEGNNVWHAGNDGSGSGLDADTVDGYHAGSFVIRANSDYGISKSIYSIDTCRIFTGQKYTDSPIALNKWVSGLALGSNWDNNHHQAYLVEGEDGRWYTTRLYENSLMKNWKTFAYLSDLPTKSSWNYDDRYLPLTGGKLERLASKISDLDSTPGSDNAWNKVENSILYLKSQNNAMAITIGKTINERVALILVGHSDYQNYAHIYGILHLNKFGGDVYINNSKAWHAGNDGSGSGLDADYVDGYHASSLGRIYSHTIQSGKCVRIKFGDLFAAIVSVRRTDGNGGLILIGNGYGENQIRNTWALVSPTSLFRWSVPATDSIGTSIEISNTAGNPANVNVLQLTNATVTFTEIDTLTTTGKDEPIANLYSNVASATKLQTARTIWGLSFDGTGNVNGDMLDASCLEFTGLGSSSGHGGYIDFHYNGSTADYTSRLIEDSSGNLNIYGNNLKVNGYPVFHSNHVLLSNGEDIVDDYGIGIVGCHGMLPANLVSDFASGNAYYNTPTGISPYNYGQVLNFFYHPDNCHFLLYVSDASSAIDMNGRYTGIFYRSGWASSGNPYYGRRPWRLILDNASILTYYGLMLDQTSTHSMLKMAYPKTSNFYNVLRYGGTNANSSDLYVGSDSRDTHIAGRDIYVDAGSYSNCIFVNNNGGSVGIGTTSPSYKLHVNGACAASSFPNTSDIRLKDVYSDWSPNIEDIAYAPSFLFKWKDGKDKNMHAGTSAQYWLSKAPELVTEAKDDIGTLSIQYDVLGTLSSITLAKEILELKKEIKRLQALIAEIKLLQK